MLEINGRFHFKMWFPSNSMFIKKHKVPDRNQVPWSGSIMPTEGGIVGILQTKSGKDERGNSGYEGNFGRAIEKNPS